MRAKLKKVLSLIVSVTVLMTYFCTALTQVVAVTTEFVGLDELDTAANLDSKNLVAFSEGAALPQNDNDAANGAYIQYKIPLGAKLEFATRTADGYTNAQYAVKVSENGVDFVAADTTKTFISNDGYWVRDTYLSDVSQYQYVRIFFEPSLWVNWKTMIDWAKIIKPVSGIKLSSLAEKISSGDMLSLTAETMPKNAENTSIDWEISDDTIIAASKVTSNSGDEVIFTALKEGVATITAKTQQGGYSKSCIVTVDDSAADMIVYTNNKMTVYFNPDTGVPVQYSVSQIGENAFFKGAYLKKPIGVLLRQLPSQKEYNLSAELVDIVKTESTVDANYKVMCDEVQAVKFTIRYSFSDLTIQATLENVVEAENYNLLDVETKSIISTYESNNKNEWFTYGDNRQYVVNLKDANVRGLDKESWQWLGISDSDYPNYGFFPIFTMGNDDAAFSFEVQGYISQSVLDVVKDTNDKKIATLGATTRYRMKGSDVTPNVLASQNEMFRMDFTGDNSKDGKITWLDMAFNLNSRMPKNDTSYYDGLYMPFGRGMDPATYYKDENGELRDPTADELTTFEEFSKLSKNMAFLIDGNPQLYSVKGWLEGGHDMAYPNVTKLNSYLGGEENYFKYKQTMETLYNAYLNFDDNFDDQYETQYSGEWFKPENVGREKDGGYKYGGLWGAQSILTDFKEYMKANGDGEKRINYTAETYKIKKGNLIDVLGLCPIRYSFNPESPASVYENVIGKKKVLEQFKNKGIEIYTEGFSYALSDALTAVHHFPTEYGEDSIFGGNEVPLSTITYRETLNYGGFSLGNENPGYYLKYNRMRVANQWGDQENQVTKEYYLYTLPYKVLSGERVVDFNISEDGAYWNYTLTNNSSIKAPSDDQNSNGYNAFYKGNQVIGSEDGGWSVCPMDDSRVAFYAMSERSLSYKLPAGQSADTIFAKALISDNQTSYPINVVNGNIVVDVPKQIPIIVYFNYDKANNNVTVKNNSFNIQYSYDPDTAAVVKWHELGDTMITNQQNDYVQYTFFGTGIDYIASKADNAEVYIDGNLKDTVNVEGEQQVAYSVNGLEKGLHSIKVLNKSGETNLISFKVYEPMNDSAVVTDKILEGKDTLIDSSKTTNYTDDLVFNNGVRLSEEFKNQSISALTTYIEYYVPKNSTIKFNVKTATNGQINYDWKVKTSSDGIKFNDVETTFAEAETSNVDWNSRTYSLSVVDQQIVRIYFPASDAGWKSEINWVEAVPYIISSTDENVIVNSSNNTIITSLSGITGSELASKLYSTYDSIVVKNTVDSKIVTGSQVKCINNGSVVDSFLIYVYKNVKSDTTSINGTDTPNLFAQDSLGWYIEYDVNYNDFCYMAKVVTLSGLRKWTVKANVDQGEFVEIPFSYVGDYEINNEGFYFANIRTNAIKNATKIRIYFEGKDWTVRIHQQDFYELQAMQQFPEVGDVNDDGKIDIRDLVSMKKLIIANKNQSSSDINADDKTNAEDLTLLRKYLLGILKNLI